MDEGKFKECITYLSSSLDKHLTRIKHKISQILCFLVFGGLFIILENDTEPESGNVSAICNDKLFLVTPVGSTAFNIRKK